MSAEDVLARHYEVADDRDGPFCNECKQDWPCDASGLAKATVALAQALSEERGRIEVPPGESEPFYSAESLARRLPRNRPLVTILWEAAHEAGVPLDFKQADAIAAVIVREYENRGGTFRPRPSSPTNHDRASSPGASRSQSADEGSPQ